MRHSYRRTLAVCACLCGAVLGSAGTAFAQAPPSCPAGIAAVPVLKAADSQDRNRATHLTATHVIVVTAEFPDDAPFSPDESTMVWTGSPGVPQLTDRSRNADEIDLAGRNQIGLQPTAAGPLPVSVSWQQSDGTRGGVCAASAGATFQIEAARPLRPSAPRGNTSSDVRRDGEYVWFTTIGTDADRRPLEVRLRSVRGARLPGPRVPFKTATIALRATDPGWGASRRLLAPLLFVNASYNGARLLEMLVGVRGVTSNPRFGYELELRQGRRRVGRIRAAGSCSAFGCDFSTFRVQR